MRHFGLRQTSSSLLLTAVCLVAGTALAQSNASGSAKTPPAVDSAAQASPLGPVHPAAATDSSAQASPLLGADPHPAASLAGGYTLTVKLDERADSGTLRNGQTLHGTLIRRLRNDGQAVAAKIQPGIPVEVTVVAAVPAGKIYAAGELSLELTQVGGKAVVTDILTFRGTPGHRDLPDSAPALGTNAGLDTGMTLTFHSQGAPTAATGASKTSGGAGAPGSVSATSAGSAAAPPKP